MTSKLNQTKQPAHPTPQKNKSPTPIPVRHHGLVESFEILVNLSPRRLVVVIAVFVLVAVGVEVPVEGVSVVVVAEVITIVGEVVVVAAEVITIAEEEESVGEVLGGVVDDEEAPSAVGDLVSLVGMD